MLKFKARQNTNSKKPVGTANLAPVFVVPQMPQVVTSQPATFTFIDGGQSFQTNNTNFKNYGKSKAVGKKFDEKTIWGSDIVKYAVNQTNDFLALEDLLYQTGSLFICTNTENNAAEFENVVRNENGVIVFYCQETQNWSSKWWSMFECSTLEFGFRMFNTSFREVLSVSGRQCCYGQGFMEIKCGCYHLGTIQQYPFCGNNEGYQYAIREPNGQVLVNLKKDSGKWNKRHYNLFRTYTNTKVGEIRQTWSLDAPIHRMFNILYGISTDLDIPTHQKHLIFGASFLLFYQKYRRWNNRRRCAYAFTMKLVILLLTLIVISVVVIYYR